MDRDSNFYPTNQLTHAFTSMDLHFKRKLESTPTNTVIKS